MDNEETMDRIRTMAKQVLIEMSDCDYTDGQRRQHLRIYLCGKMQGEGMDPVQLGPLVQRVVGEVMPRW